MRGKDIERALRILDELEFHNPKVYIQVSFLRMLFEEELVRNKKVGHQGMTKDHKQKLHAGHKEYFKGLKRRKK